MNEQDLELWCDETLPELYDEGMFDYEETSEDVWEAVAAAMEPVLDAFEEEADREEMADALTEAAREWFRLHHETVIEAIPTVPTYRITDLCNKPQTAQHTAEWYNQRRNRLTASEFQQILDGRRGALLRQKLSADTGDRVGFVAPVGIAQPDGEMNATTWGHRFESVVKRIYELELAGTGTVNAGLGRFTHPSIKWLSASPDGLVTEGPLQGRLVEIKAPKTRQPGEFVPAEYYVQMQIQMEVCNLDAVDFVEAQFKQRPVEALTQQDQYACDKATWKGRIEVRGYLDEPATWKYRYTEPVEDLEDAVFSASTESEDPLLESSVWWLTGWYPRTVLRNRVWWQTVGWPNAELFWAEVESLRGQYQDQDQDTIVHVEDGWIGS